MDFFNKGAFITRYMPSTLVIIESLLLVFFGCSTSQKEQAVQKQDRADARLPKEITSRDGASMMLIPAGEFRMGSNDGLNNEKPAHTVYLDAFYMDKYEVTNAQYRRFVQETGHREPKGRREFKPWSDDNFNGDDHPVVCVKWEDAKAYAEWAGKRLPTEAEWEKAARGGRFGWKYTWGGWEDYLIRNHGNFAGILRPGSRDKWNYTAPVGSFLPNGYGLYDMAGNVSEWCADWYDKGYYAKSPRRNPTGPRRSWIRRILEGSHHVARGGSWDNFPSYMLFDKPLGISDPEKFSNLRLANRGSFSRYRPIKYIGFRCAKSASTVSIVAIVEHDPSI